MVLKKYFQFLILFGSGVIIWFFGVWFGACCVDWEYGIQELKAVLRNDVYDENVIPSRAQRVEGSQSIGEKRTVVLKVDLGDAKISYATKIEKPILVFDLLQRAAKEKKFVLKYKNYSGMGAFITKIGNKENGKSGKYWRYFVNGKYAQVGASSYLLKGGEVVEWRFL